MSAQPFWKTKTLAEMTAEEWEALCDGCARCCLHKLEDADTGVVHYTDVACRLLDVVRCRCRDYPQRTRHVSDCFQLSPFEPEQFEWLPSTCAYRLLAAGKELPRWHPLVSGNPRSVHKVGISVRGYAVSESRVPDPDDLEDHIIDWLP